MIRLSITEEQIERSKTRFDFGALPNSISKGKKNEFGALGEILVLDYYRSIGADITDEGTRDYDIKLNGRTVDVKTRNLTNAPKPYHFCNIPAYSIKQNCEFYFFVFIRRDKTVGWIVGYIDKQKFNNVARLYKSGEPSGYNFTFPVDSFQVIIRQLEDIKKA